MKNKIRFYVTVLALFLACAVTLQGQESHGAVSGTIVDPGGAAIPSATVIVTEVRTGVETPTKSNATGSYNLPFLAPGEYQIQVEAPGFRTFVRSGIGITSSDHAVIDVQLQVGQSTQTVNVVAEAPLLDTANAAVGQTITTQQVEDLPLNGRTPMMLAELSVGVLITPSPGTAPGQVHPFDNNAAAGWSIGGTPSQNNELLIDGSPDAVWSGSLAYSPPEDAVQEVTVKAFDNDATYGHTVGGTLNQVLKTGTNAFHGSAYEFSQVSALDANNYFNDRANVPNPVTHFNQYGLTAGGPVIIPKVFNGKDKLFWFFAWENLNDSQPTTDITTVPTDAERNGDFSALLNSGSQFQIYNPFSATQSGKTITRQPFTNNIIPSGMINPIAQAYLKFYPEPNLPGTSTGLNNYISSPPSVDTFDNELGRLDYNMSERNKVFFDMRHNFRTQIKNDYFNNPATGTTLTRLNWGDTLDDVYTFNSSTVLDVRANWTYFGEVHGEPSKGLDPTTLGFPSNIAGNSQYLQMPFISFGSCGSQTSFQCLGDTGASRVPSQSYQLFGDLVKVVGKHSFKFGFDGRRYNLDAVTFGSSTATTTGLYTFGTNWTQGPTSTSSAAPFGQDFASFLLGLPTAGAYAINARTALHEYYYAGFVQDDWRLTNNLTVDLGVRFDHDSPYIEQQGRTVNGFAFDTPNPVAASAQAAYAKNPNALLPAANFAVNGGLLFPPPDNGTMYHTDSHMFSPRVGISWSPAALRQKTVFRAGFGMFVAPITVANLGSNGTFSSNPILNTEGFSATTSQVVTNNSFLTPATTLSNPFPGGIAQPVGSSLGLSTFVGQNIQFFAPNIKDPYSLRWNFGVQHELGKDILVEVDYMGNHGVHLPVAVTQVNVIPRQFLSTLPNRDPTVINELSASTPNPFAGLLPGTSINGSTIATSQLLSLYPEFPQGSGSTSNGIIEQNNTIGSSYFESLDARVEKRFSHGLTLIGNYEFSKLIEADTFLNDTDTSLTRRLSPFDHPHHFVVGATYELPIGRGKLVNLESGWANALLGGWVINGIYSFQVGQPVLWSNGDYAFCSQPVFKAPSTGATKTQQALNGLCVDSSGNLLPAADFSSVPLDFNPRQTNGPAFNTADFVSGSNPSATLTGTTLTAAQLAALQQTGQLSFHIRTFPQTLGNVRQDGINNIDASILKNFNFTERTYLQLRLETFDLFNHPEFGLPNVTPNSSAFGTITSQVNLPRQVQLGARIVF